jgi:hypothetical protein
MINKAGTVSPTNGPAIYQGQGSLINSKISMFIFLIIQRLNFKKTSCVTFVTQEKKSKKSH